MILYSYGYFTFPQLWFFHLFIFTLYFFGKSRCRFFSNLCAFPDSKRGGINENNDCLWTLPGFTMNDCYHAYLHNTRNRGSAAIGGGRGPAKAHPGCSWAGPETRSYMHLPLKFSFSSDSVHFFLVIFRCAKIKWKQIKGAKNFYGSPDSFHLTASSGTISE